MNIRPLLPLSLLLVTLFGCDSCNKEKKVVKDTETNKGPVVATAADQMTEAIQLTAENCEVSGINRITKCTGPGQNEMKQLLQDHNLEVLPAIASSLGSIGKAEEQHTAAFLIKTEGPKLWRRVSEKKLKLNPNDIEFLWGQMKPQSTRQGRLLADTAKFFIEGATLAGKPDLVNAFFDHYSLEKDKSFQSIHYLGTRGLMTYGRMTHFDRIKELAKSEDPIAQRYAFAAPLEMLDWTEEESNVICPWAEANLKKDDTRHEKGAIQLLTRCKDKLKWRMVLLKEADRRLKEKKYTKPTTVAVRLLCAKHLSKETGPDEVCKEANAHLKRVIKDDSAPMDLRLFSMSNLSESWYDPEDIEFIGGYLTSDKERLVKRAEITQRRMQNRRDADERARLAAEQDIQIRGEFWEPPEKEKDAPKDAPATP